ncbi:hypothetical protein ONS96_003092 [Cadophora gregata f. sp. sojae]|nr:hypothetical protein ONS96_003092 [Cadophora gregata f. sp. sojae]
MRVLMEIANFSESSQVFFRRAVAAASGFFDFDDTGFFWFGIPPSDTTQFPTHGLYYLSVRFLLARDLCNSFCFRGHHLFVNLAVPLDLEFLSSLHRFWC